VKPLLYILFVFHQNASLTSLRVRINVASPWRIGAITSTIVDVWSIVMNRAVRVYHWVGV
jgi:hypothetical protein